MATTDQLQGIVNAVVNITAQRSNPSGQDTYRVSEGNSWENTESVANTTAFRIYSVFQEDITVTSTESTLSLASFTDPMGGAGSNVPSSDPEGGFLKILFLYNHSPADGTGRS